MLKLFLVLYVLGNPYGGKQEDGGMEACLLDSAELGAKLDAAFAEHGGAMDGLSRGDVSLKCEMMDPALAQ